MPWPIRCGLINSQHKLGQAVLTETALKSRWLNPLKGRFSVRQTAVWSPPSTVMTSGTCSCQVPCSREERAGESLRVRPGGAHSLSSDSSSEQSCDLSLCRENRDTYLSWSPGR